MGGGCFAVAVAERMQLPHLPPAELFVLCKFSIQLPVFKEDQRSELAALFGAAYSGARMNPNTTE